MHIMGIVFIVFIVFWVAIPVLFGLIIDKIIVRKAKKPQSKRVKIIRGVVWFMMVMIPLAIIVFAVLNFKMPCCY